MAKKLSTTVKVKPYLIGVVIGYVLDMWILPGSTVFGWITKLF